MNVLFLVFLSISFIFIVILFYYGFKKGDKRNFPQEYKKDKTADIIQNKLNSDWKIIMSYADSLAEETDLIVKPLSMLKYSKREILEAMSDYIRISTRLNILSEEVKSKILTARECINSFVEDDKANLINKVFKLLFEKKYEEIDPKERELAFQYFQESLRD